MSMMPDNSRAVSGSNVPDYAKQAAEQQADTYAAVVNTLDELMEEARTLRASHVKIDDDELAVSVGAIMKRLGEIDRRMENIRIAEGEAPLRTKNGIDAFWFHHRDRVGRREKRAQAGAIDILGAMLADYQERKLALEQARRHQAALDARKDADQLLAEAEQAERERLAAEASAARARKPENIALKNDAAAAASVAATTATAAAVVAESKADEAHFDSLAKPADMVRTRGTDASGAGVTLTMAKEPVAIVLDGQDHKLDKEKLWPFISLDAKEKALRAWAKTTGHKQPMDGAEIGHRNKSVVR